MIYSLDAKSVCMKVSIWEVGFVWWRFVFIDVDTPSVIYISVCMYACMIYVCMYVCIVC